MAGPVHQLDHPVHRSRRRIAALSAALLMAATVSACRRTPPPPPPISVQQLEALRDSAERLLAAGRPTDAMQVSRTLAEQASDDWTALELHARIAAAVALELDPGPGAESTTTALSDRLTDLRRASIAHYDAAAALISAKEPRVAARLLRSSAMMLDANGEPDLAFVRYGESAALDPEETQAPLFAAQLQLRRGRLDDARSMIGRVLQIDEHEPWAWATLAEIERADGRDDEAFECIRKARSLDPENTIFRLREARLLRLFGRAEEALTLLLALPGPERATSPFVEEISMGWCALDEPRRSAEAWEGLARSEPQDWRWPVEAATWWLRAGDPQRAAVALEPALRIAPDDPRVRQQRDAVGAALNALTESSDPRPGAASGP